MAPPGKNMKHKNFTGKNDSLKKAKKFPEGVKKKRKWIPEGKKFKGSVKEGGFLIKHFLRNMYVIQFVREYFK